MVSSTCIRPEKDSQAARIKLLTGVVLFVQPPLAVLSRNTKIPFSGTNSIVNGVQDNELLLLHSVLASNRLDTSGLLTING